LRNHLGQRPKEGFARVALELADVCCRAGSRGLVHALIGPTDDTAWGIEDRSIIAA
jgi:hypothetical protein